VPIKWLKDEGRNPHVNFYGVRYQGEGLNRAALRQKKVRVLFDRRDIRTLKAFTQDGKEIGLLYASKSWRLFRHSLATRQQINKFVAQDQYREHDALGNHFRYLLEHKGQETCALQILKIYQEYTEDGALPLILSEGQQASSTPSTATWSTTMANHEE